MSWFKRKYKKSDWFKGLLECEQHVYEGYDTVKLYNVSVAKLRANELLSDDVFYGIQDYLWYYENILTKSIDKNASIVYSV